MRLKLDENLSRHLKPSLISLGHDVATVADESLLGHPDPIIARPFLKDNPEGGSNDCQSKQ